jgi:hypothetical protein
LWWFCPGFLENPESTLNLDINMFENPKEIVCVTLVCAIPSKSENCFYDFIDKCLSLLRMQQFVAWIMRFCINIKKKSIRISSNYLICNELKDALYCIIKYEQQKYFQSVKMILKCNCPIKSNMKSLNSFLDINIGVLRLNAQSTYTQFKHQAILPKESRFISLIIYYEHIVLMHASKKRVKINLFQRYWKYKYKYFLVYNCIILML